MRRPLLDTALAVCLTAGLTAALPATALAHSSDAGDESAAVESSGEQSSPIVVILAHSELDGWMPLSFGGYALDDPDEPISYDSIRIALLGVAEEGSVSYQAYVEGSGWSDWVSDGESVGTDGATIGGIRVKLTDALAESFDVYYRVYSQDCAWMGWACDGQVAGTPGMGFGIGSLQVELAAKDAAAPGSTKDHVKLPETLTRKSLLRELSAVDSSDGLTVFGGSYDLDSEAGRELQEAMDALIDSGYTVDFVMIDLTTGQGLAYHAEELRYSASSIKGPYVCAINKYSTSDEISSWKDTMETTIVDSSNSGYATLRVAFGADPMTRYMAYADVDSFSSSSYYVNLSSIDLAKLWVANYYYLYIDTGDNSKYCRNLFTHSSHSFIYQELGDDYKVNSKPGWLDSYSGGAVQNDGGIVFSDGGPYVMAILTSAYEEFDLLGDLAAALDDVHVDMVG